MSYEFRLRFVSFLQPRELTLVTGDQLKAKALANGTVIVYRNGVAYFERSAAEGR